jgi:hypothetical protein
MLTVMRAVKRLGIASKTDISRNRRCTVDRPLAKGTLDRLTREGNFSVRDAHFCAEKVGMLGLWLALPGTD